MCVFCKCYCIYKWKIYGQVFLVYKQRKYNNLCSGFLASVFDGVMNVEFGQGVKIV